MTGRINEIFESIQGEGVYFGQRQVFVRFSGCNLSCNYCDTEFGLYREYQPGDVLLEIKALGTGFHSVSFTGGEPLLQKDFLKETLKLVKENGYSTYLETNGTLAKELREVIGDLDIVAMDIKLPSSTKCRAYWKEHADFLKVALKKDTFIKAVVSSDTAKDDIVKAVDLVKKIDPNVLFILQPNTYELSNGVMKKCLEFQDYCLKYLPNARILPQVHKFMKIP